MTKTNKQSTKLSKLPYVWAAMRILIGLVFLWAFFDKMFGLGYSTCRSIDPVTKQESVVMMCDDAVIKGGSATNGFLNFAAGGPFENSYKSLAGNSFVDFLFMAGLGLIGGALTLGVGIKIATFTGSLLLFLMWLALVPSENNPVIDNHIVYIVALIGIYLVNDEQAWGLGKWWQSQALVKKYPILA